MTLRGWLKSQCWKIDILRTWDRITGVHTHKRWNKTSESQGAGNTCDWTAQRSKTIKTFPWHGTILPWPLGKTEQHACPSHLIGWRVWSDRNLKAKGAKKAPWHWDLVHQRGFDHVKATIAKEVVLAYPDFSKVFEIYRDTSSKQLGAVITHDCWPIAFFSRKLFPNWTTSHSQNT